MVQQIFSDTHIFFINTFFSAEPEAHNYCLKWTRRRTLPPWTMTRSITCHKNAKASLVHIVRCLLILVSLADSSGKYFSSLAWCRQQAGLLLSSSSLQVDIFSQAHTPVHFHLYGQKKCPFSSFAIIFYAFQLWHQSTAAEYLNVSKPTQAIMIRRFVTMITRITFD